MNGIKNMNEMFLDAEYRRLSRAKVKSGARSWHDFIMILAEEDIQEQEHGNQTA